MSYFRWIVPVMPVPLANTKMHRASGRLSPKGAILAVIAETKCRLRQTPSQSESLGNWWQNREVLGAHPSRSLRASRPFKRPSTVWCNQSRVPTIRSGGGEICLKRAKELRVASLDIYQKKRRKEIDEMTAMIVRDYATEKRICSSWHKQRLLSPPCEE